LGFEDAALKRLLRYREDSGRSLSSMRNAEEESRGFSERLFAGLSYTASLAREVGIDAESQEGDGLLTLRVTFGEGADASLVLGKLPGTAAETEEDLMHEELSRYSQDPSGYSGRIIGFCEAVGEAPCQTFAVYRDGLWKTRGIFVEGARGRTDDPDEVLNGFCLRILGRLIDLASLTGGAGRAWSQTDDYTREDLAYGATFPTDIRLPR
jgi:hypothetical protein